MLGTATRLRQKIEKDLMEISLCQSNIEQFINSTDEVDDLYCQLMRSRIDELRAWIDLAQWELRIIGA
jgi:hypothetical protein